MSNINLVIKRFCILFLVLQLLTDNEVKCADSYSVYNWKYHFPSGSGMGIYAALALPVPDSANIDLFYAVFFEAYYSLPYNETTFEYPPLVDDRTFGRKTLYEAIEEKLNLKGFQGKNCLLKAICEAASFTTLHANGIVGDLIHLLFTPSSSEDDNEANMSDYLLAEEAGLRTQNCETYKDCYISLLDLISIIK